MVVDGEKPNESILLKGMPKRTQRYAQRYAGNHLPLGKHFPDYYTLAF